MALVEKREKEMGEGKRKDLVSSTEILLDPKIGSVLEGRHTELLDLK